MGKGMGSVMGWRIPLGHLPLYQNTIREGRQAYMIIFEMSRGLRRAVSHMGRAMPYAAWVYTMPPHTMQWAHACGHSHMDTPLT